MKFCLNGEWGGKKIGEGGKWCPKCLGEFESLPGLGGPLGRAVWWSRCVDGMPEGAWGLGHVTSTLLDPQVSLPL